MKNIGEKKRLVAILSLFCTLILLFGRWIQITNADVLYEFLGTPEEELASLSRGYTIYTLLSFVQHSGAYILGLYSMILLLIAVAAGYFQIVLLVRVLLSGKKSSGNKSGKERGDLAIYGSAEAAMILNILLTVLTFGYVVFGNSQFGIKGMYASPYVYISLILSLICYGITKKEQKKERDRYREHGLWKEIKKNWVLFVMLIPAAIYFLINCYLPMIGVYYAFTSFNFRDGLWASPFVGMKNFEYLFKANLWRLVRNTVLYNVVFIVVGNILRIFFAILVSQIATKWFKKLSQTMLFMPYFVSFVILNVIVYNLFEYDYGVVNNLIVRLGGERLDFYNTKEYWPFLITFFHMWKDVGYGMVVYLATIMGIDAELYDAGKVDGANVFQQIRYITLPQLKPTFVILLLYSIGSIMKGQFELFYQMVGNNGILYEVTDIIDTYVYRIALTQPLSIGTGTAAGLFQSVFGFVLVLITNWVVKKTNDDLALF